MTASSAPTAPDAAAKQARIDRSIKSIWRTTPYKIVRIAYQNEQTRPIGDTGAAYEANITVELKFPQGWNADCFGPGAAYGCQFLDANLMQMKPIPAGDTRTYSGSMNMSRMGQAGNDWEGSVRWEQRVE